ncbi:hypothetical protein [Fontibacter flavus]|uniref:VanZ like family protein n=1 Tax=Fontibacter flavus TaxID=654838 RepID=A0ABV6FYF5_9BACT
MKKNYLSLFLLSILIFVLFRFPYRTFIYSEGIFDFYVADTSPNFLSVFVYVFYHKWRFANHRSSIFLILSILLGLIFYEIVFQRFISIQTFDFKDLIASFLGSVICFFVCLKFENRKFKDEVHLWK